MKEFFGAWVFCAIAATAVGAGSEMPVLDEADPPVVAVFVEPGMRLSQPMEYERHMVRVAAWKDGRVVWSHNLDEGGSPYFRGKVSPEKIEEVLALGARVSAKEYTRTDFRMPDASSTHVVLQGATPTTNLAWISAHPNYESSKATFTSKGLVSPTEIDHSAPVSAEEVEFRQFRKEFDLLKESILGLAPSEKLKFH